MPSLSRSFHQKSLALTNTSAGYFEAQLSRDNALRSPSLRRVASPRYVSTLVFRRLPASEASDLAKYTQSTGTPGRSSSQPGNRTVYQLADFRSHGVYAQSDSKAANSVNQLNLAAAFRSTSQGATTFQAKAASSLARQNTISGLCRRVHRAEEQNISWSAAAVSSKRTVLEFANALQEQMRCFQTEVTVHCRRLSRRVDDVENGSRRLRPYGGFRRTRTIEAALGEQKRQSGFDSGPEHTANEVQSYPADMYQISGQTSTERKCDKLEGEKARAELALHKARAENGRLVLQANELRNSVAQSARKSLLADGEILELKARNEALHGKIEELTKRLVKSENERLSAVRRAVEVAEAGAAATAQAAQQ